jgi:hypothetical protein
MSELITGIFSAPIATLFVVAGMVFLLIAVVGNISGRIEPGAKGRIASGVLGVLFLVVGLAIHFLPDAEKRASAPPEETTEQVSQTPAQPAAGQTPTTTVPGGAQQAAVTERDAPALDVEPSNDHISGAALISMGSTVRGSLATNKDRDFYRFDAPTSRTRVIVRKPSPPGVNVEIEIYDRAEKKIASDVGYGDVPATLSFEGEVGATYYAVVKPVLYNDRGDYELVVREE